MARKAEYQPPKRIEPGLLGKTISAVVQFISWLVISLLVSIVIEWLGMAYYWTEQGAAHAQAVLAADQAYLNAQVTEKTLFVKTRLLDWTYTAMEWIDALDWRAAPLHRDAESQPGFYDKVLIWLAEKHRQYRDYFQAAEYVSQTFVIRLGLIVFSLPVFLLAILVGAVDGLIERDLRRWGGGRESSNVFTLARRTITPLFVLACVIYISLPVSLDPVLIILPFAMLVGLSVRISFERLKKYF